jgi:hypothetical protein
MQHLREEKNITPAEFIVAAKLEQVLQIFFDITDSIIAMTF